VKCGHPKSVHAEPIVWDGRCTHCPCDGFDPLTTAQWEIVMADDRARRD
jgi:hypothetical protein